MKNAPLIDISDISVGFTGRSGQMMPVLRNIDLVVRRGESVGLVGESGSGKSTLALAAMGYLKRGLQLMDGSVTFRGDDMFGQTRQGKMPRGRKKDVMGRKNIFWAQGRRAQ